MPEFIISLCCSSILKGFFQFLMAVVRNGPLSNHENCRVHNDWNLCFHLSVWYTCFSVDVHHPNGRDLDWKKVYNLPFKVTKNTKLQWLQNRINHHILVTNYFLLKVKIIDNPDCTFCHTKSETVLHIQR
jgi:hypothetical protein